MLKQIWLDLPTQTEAFVSMESFITEESYRIDKNLLAAAMQLRKYLYNFWGISERCINIH